MKELFQSGDWAKEKHVPIIDILKVDKEEGVVFTVSVGKEISHPNTTAHHIAWIDIYFKPDGSKFPYQLGKCEFFSHGASVGGADTSGIYNKVEATLSFKTEQSGIIYASSYCNIHGLWESMKEVEI